MAPRQPMAAPTQSVAHVQQDKKVDATALLEEIVAKTAQQQPYDAGRFAPKTSDELWQLAETWYWAELLPEAYYPSKKEIGYAARWEDKWARRGINRAYIVMRHGASLGVLPEPSIKGIYIVEGTPCPSSSLMLAMAFAKGLLRREDWRIVEATRAKVVVELFGTSRKPERVEAKYEDYKHLHGKNTWQQYPEDMLLARAVGRAMRRYFADAYAGVYAAEELADARQDRLAGRIEDPVERILAAVDAPSDDMSAVAPPLPAQAPEAPQDGLDEAARFAKQVKDIERRVAAAGESEIEGLREEIKALPDSAEKRGLVRAWQARSKELTVVATPAQSGEGGGT